MGRTIRLGAAALLAGLLAAGAAAARPPVWVVRDADSELVLFGSVHILPPGLDWRPPALEQAVKEADDVWFELPIDQASEQETVRLAAQLGLLAPGQSLFKLLPERDAERTLKVARQYGADPALLDRFKPWLAEVALSGAAFRKAGAEGQDGVEKAVAAEVPPTAVRRAFETPREQIDILAGGGWDEQVASLSETVKEMQEKPDEFAQLVRTWMAGDLKGLDREALAPLRRVAPSLVQRLVDDRNARWTKVLDERLKGHGRTVVVVGMGHLIGPGGVPARLRALGYSVEGP
jgi:uncharacterized protein YbaP (TraB family)